MSRADRRARRISSTSMRHDSVVASEANEHQPSNFPPHHQLIVTTTKNIYVWHSSDIAELFHSVSGGIVAAKLLSSQSDMLAVADSQLVVLHDVKKGMQKSYRLRSNEVSDLLLSYCNDND